MKKFNDKKIKQIRLSDLLKTKENAEFCFDGKRYKITNGRIKYFNETFYGWFTTPIKSFTEPEIISIVNILNRK